MDVDSGNALSVVTSSEKERTGKNVEVDLEKAEVDVDESRLGTHAESSMDGDEPLEPVSSRIKELPFSKARLVALVITLTGAAFLNVRLTLKTSRSYMLIRGLDTGCSSRRYHSSEYWESPQYSRQSPAMDRIGLLFDIRLFPTTLWENS